MVCFVTDNRGGWGEGPGDHPLKPRLPTFTSKQQCYFCRLPFCNPGSKSLRQRTATNSLTYSKSRAPVFLWSLIYNHLPCISSVSRPPYSPAPCSLPPTHPQGAPALLSGFLLVKQPAPSQNPHQIPKLASSRVLDSVTNDKTAALVTSFSSSWSRPFHLEAVVYSERVEDSWVSHWSRRPY